MLVELRIRNFAIIEEAALEFGAGLNVLSGETGAGKTIILSALGLLLGERASPDLVRGGEREAAVEGLFELEGEVALPELAERSGARTRQLLVRRVIAEGGRSRALVDGDLATLQSLSRIGNTLVQVYGQHEQQSLLRPESHREILDGFAGLESELAGYRKTFEYAHALQNQLAELAQRERQRGDLLELARFRVGELERAALIAGEDQALTAERAVLANAAKLAQAAGEAESALSGDERAALDLVAEAETRLADAAAIDPKLAEPLEMIRVARTNLAEAARALSSYAARIEADPARLEEAESRLQELNRLKRKYGGTLEAALETLERSRIEIADLERVGESKADLESQLRSTLDDLLGQARQLTKRRSDAAAELKRRVEAELKTLGMRAPVFEARLGPLANEDGVFQHAGAALGTAGADTVEFYLAANVGQTPLPLARIASGGELSRVMLALKRLEAQRRGIATMIFDEVDAGIGGAVATVVGRKLHQLARYHQVLCVTHLAQIAVFADRHFRVEKEERRGSTRSRVTLLEKSERPEEIARMLGGEQSSDKFLRAAKELLERAAE
ncbi:MAG TPA: DNA repair protein RecN [Candidatus Binataceae bacterium]|nr:DNA repair protein RecN [Candidatus Binataceae bacterium]